MSLDAHALKYQLMSLLGEDISPVVLANCIELIQREQVGIGKYGQSLSDSGLSREQLVQHALEEALDLSNYLRQELHRSQS